MSTNALVRICLFAAIIAVLGLLPRFDIPLAGGVPVTAQTLGVMLAGVILGPRLGALAVILFVFVVALGAPLLAGGRGGLGVFFGPSAGFLLGWIPGAYVCGAIMDWLRRFPVLPSALIAAFGGGVVVVYAVGIAGLMWRTQMTLTQATLASLVFLPGDILKAIATGFITEIVWRADRTALLRKT